jgi:CysZ protein
MWKFIKELIIGITYPIKAIAFLIQNPELRGFVIIPIIINFVVGNILYFTIFITGTKIIDQLINNLVLPTWASAGSIILEWIIRVIFALILLLTTGLIIVQFGIILGAPWYGMLSENIEKKRLGQLPPQETLTPISIIRDITRAILYEIKKILLAIAIGVPLFILGFIPLVGGIITTLGSIILSATIICLDFFDSPLERRKLTFRQKLSIVIKQIPASATFGIVSLFLISIPLLNLLIIPLCITAGTLFFCDRIFPEHSEIQEKQQLTAKGKTDI